LSNGSIEEHGGVDSVGALKQIIADLPDNMRLADYWGNPVEIVIARPVGAASYMEVQ